MARKSKKTRTPARARAATQFETTWNDARRAIRSAEGVLGKRVAEFARRRGIDTKELVHRAELWRSRLDRESRKARKRVELRLAELSKRAHHERNTVARVADDAVARALAALNIPTRREVQELSRRVGRLSSRIDTIRAR